MNFSTDWRRMLTPIAKRNTPLKKLPRIWARCHPKDNLFGGLLLSDSCASSQQSITEYSLEDTHLESDKRNNEADEVVQLDI
jgi:hypothetical protein